MTKDAHFLPTFIGVGVARSGTTTLYRWLKQHAEIFMSPIKETNFFAFPDLKWPFSGPGDQVAISKGIKRDKDGKIIETHAAFVTSPDEYLELFKGSENYRARGEISPSYLYVPGSASRIWKLMPTCKIIILLRNPVERAFSNYTTLYMGGRETQDFETALALEDERMKKGCEHFWALKSLGLYYSQAKRYLDLFPRQQVGIWLFEDLRSRPIEVIRDIYRFIVVDDSFVPDTSTKYNTATRDENPLLLRLRTDQYWRKVSAIVPSPVKSVGKQAIRKLLGTKKLTMKPSTRRWLLEFYKEDILKLNKLLPELEVTRWIEEEEEKLRREIDG